MVSRSRWAKRGRTQSTNIIPRVPLREKEQASLVCSDLYVSAGSGAMNVNAPYTCYNVQMTQFGRANVVARAYQEYRITKVTMRFKPSFDAYIPAAGVSKPNLYYLIDKSQSVGPLASAAAFRDMGCQPIQFDEGNIDISFVPAVLESVMYAPIGPGAAQSSRPILSPWLATNAVPGGNPWAPSGVDHGGIQWFLEAYAGGGNQYQVEIQAEFEFRKALTTLNA